MCLYLKNIFFFKALSGLKIVNHLDQCFKCYLVNHNKLAYNFNEFVAIKV